MIVYHWSPSKNRNSILKNGLTVLNGNAIEYENPVTGKNETWIPPYICTSPDAWKAYVYVTPMFRGDDLPELDLYQVTLTEKDDCIFRNDRTIEIIEVRVLNSIPADRVKYLATRESEY